MFKGTITKTISGSSEDFCLLINPLGSDKAAKLIFFDLEVTKKESTVWELYMSPTITSNGTAISITKLDNHRPGVNSILLFRNPTILTRGLPVRKFTLPSSTQEFSTNGPTAQLEAGESILLRRITTSSNSIKSNWVWEEISTQ